MVRLLTGKLSENPLRYLTKTLPSEELIITVGFGLNKSVLFQFKNITV